MSPWPFKSAAPTDRRITVFTALPGLGPQGADAAVNGAEVVLFNPPVALDIAGDPQGTTHQLIGEYLAANIAAFADQDLGPMTVTWSRREGRFAVADIQVNAWGEHVSLVQPIQPISIELAEVWKIYQHAMALKIRETHKQTQNFGEANRLLRAARCKLDELRDNPQMQFSRSEYLFLSAILQNAQVQSALVGIDAGELP